MQDLRDAFRALKATPVVSIVAIVSLALGIGANTAIFSILDALLLRSLPVKEIVTTNTVPVPPEKRLPNMTILSVAPLLGEVILRAHEGRSVGELFNE